MSPVDWTIRQASAPDVGAVVAADDLPRSDYLRSAIDSGSCWLAESGRIVLGFVIFDRSFFGYPFVWLVVVVAAHRRRGVATALLRHVESICGGEKLFTSTIESNTASQRLMERMGFIRSGMVENLDEGDPELFYFKRLPKTT